MTHEEPCPHCGGETEWLRVESVDPEAPEEDVLICFECGELKRRILYGEDAVDDDDLSPPTDADFEAWNDYSGVQYD